jgi:hypothetical protein
MTLRVLQRKAYDRFGSPVLTDAGALRWVLEAEDGPILTRSYFNTQEEAQQAMRAARLGGETTRSSSPAWLLEAQPVGWRL